ncbi:MAG TPA: amino acid adenylation domain-containing protein, partial [Ktedonobacteraceae bacterium]|nr:amino acid adenylation domain-containing protein [Ktedonobacteraceae bacterium]
MTKKSTSRGFQLSPQQKRIWRLHNEPPDSQVQAIVRIAGPLQKGRLKRAISQQIKHQSILRTNFSRLAGMDFPLQVITDEARLAWQEIDLRWLKPEDQQVCMDEIIQAEHSRLFDLEQEPLVRFSLFLLAPLEYVLLISQHALCADAASLSNLASAISQSYAGVSTQPPEEEDIQYVQFAGWQNSLLEEEASSGKAYWTRQQAQILPVKLPFEQPSLSPAPFRSAMLTRKLDAQLIIRLNALAQTSSISLSSFLLAGWLLLLSRLSEQAEITLGYVCDGRKYEELSSLLGTCTTCLPLRRQVDETLSFYQLLTSLDETVHQHEEWLEYFTWETLQGASELHGASHCSVGFACWSQPASWTNGGVTFTLEPLSVCIDRFKVMLVCTFTNEGVLTEFSFDETSLSREGIECLAEQFHTLLESCARSPQSPLAQITHLSEASKQFLLQTLNQTSTALPAEQCIHQIIEAQVILAPDAIAVVYKDEHLTYHTLDKRANHVAHALSQSYVERGMLVGLRVEQSPALVIGMLGILKRGAAYLPLAPEWPDERLRLLAEEAGFIFLLTQQHLAISSPLPRIHQIVLNADESGVTVVSEQASSSQVGPADLAYVIFTSGSTGRPKGVCIEHRNLANYTYAMLERLQLSAPASFALISSYTVDLGNTMIYPALCSGGTLHILPQEWITDTEALAAWCLRRPNDCLKIVPVHLQALLAHPQGKHILPRQCLIFGGDILSWELADHVQALAPACTLLNHYGPTETTVGSLLFPIDPAAPLSTLTVPAGRPLLNTQIYVLDDQYQPVSIGTPGELYIGGMGVGRGYLNRADLTAQAFIPHPFSTDPGMRLYKTGDRVRFQPDGTLEFLGRRDRQVKIRGFRIELEEIEYILQRYPTIEAAAVDVDDAQTKRLLAYLVCPSMPDNKEVQRYLQQYLPEYMFPSAFIQVNELPLLPNGKLDRQGLRTIGRTRQTQHVAPTDRPRKFLEQELVRLWEQTLNVPQIGVHDNFFELGGDSILSIQVVARASQAGISITPKQMISHQTIAELAEVVTVMQTDL